MANSRANRSSGKNRLPKGQYSAAVAGGIGGIVGLLLIFIPASPVLGGGISRYLLDDNSVDTEAARLMIKSAVIAGLVMFIPLFVLFLFFSLFIVGRAELSGTDFTILGQLLIVGGILFGYTMGLSLFGSVLVDKYII